MTIHPINRDAATRNFRAWLAMAADYIDNVYVDFAVVLVGHADSHQVEVTSFNADMRDLTWAAVTLNDQIQDNTHLPD